ncbi:deoxyribodipyrimidine photo-lyase [Algoriphagus sp. D3-2-R+10]|uniref:cryptochrome/photolyase family protein n=1 Tax=Algoriphagus aurantiacus TaxID=3103948 RepID=UPI002B3AF60F|nr:deoxyribodipyrimidine photo-lyase [Algoriphagus sp. D3-2-R+10]MEB2775980.1 deoxyribodipyrimidine photo-lyase [Algoriphagus sp. D3-2-R+10]
MKNVSIFWFRRDLRLEDNHGLYQALSEHENVLPLFIFDKNILDKLANKADARVEFIHNQISQIHRELGEKGSSILVRYGDPEAIYKELLDEYSIQAVYTNRDYEPYAKSRDEKVERLLNQQDIPLCLFKDQLIFEPGEILNGSREFYKVFTPFSKAWLSKFDPSTIEAFKPMHWKNLLQIAALKLPTLEEIGFSKSDISIPSKTADEGLISDYNQTRDFPAKNGTSRLGIHLRFGTISIRKLVLKANELNTTFLNELIWREFYMMILAFNPEVVDQAFKPAYDRIPWRNNEEEFAAWCEGKTGYPIVDAGMRELNTTGYMHNRVRMIVASFLTKHLLIDWRWGEAYFAEKLLDYELASNSGGWQWAAGTGTDAQPYFRVFNPASQQKKFDKNWMYIKKWIPEINSDKYPKPIVDHKFARQRAIDTYKSALNQ